MRPRAKPPEGAGLALAFDCLQDIHRWKGVCERQAEELARNITYQID